MNQNATEEAVCTPTFLKSKIVTDSGIPAIGLLKWGTHFCNFYTTPQDLMEVLIPYFQKGLNNNELCVWINSEDTNIVYNRLIQDIPDIKTKIDKGQMLLFEREVCFRNACAETAEPLLANILALEKNALKQGYTGLRVAGGPTNFSTPQAKNDFLCFENKVCATLYNHKIIALCCYRTCESDSKVIFDVIKSHQFALILQDGQWEMVENASLKVLKEELQKQNNELENQVKLRTMELENALKSREHFLSIASHELKTPITALSLYVDGILSMDKKYVMEHVEEFMNLIRKIKDQSLCLEILINKLLDFTLVLNEKNIPLELQYFDLSNMIQRVVEKFAGKCRSAKCEIKTNVPSSLTVFLDPTRIEQVLTNLIDNAIKYAPEQPISINLRPDFKGIILEIKDQGKGIARSYQELVFKPYMQLLSNKTQNGMGLGLWLVQQIVTAHKGNISLVSDIGRGCHFIIKLPTEVS
ncbi:MEDS domain-containing protein [Legionella sp. WA2024007413]